jgi:hypothetical protein
MISSPCGSGTDVCTECCRLLEVKEINKPALTKCGHACAQGCKVHDSKPAACVGFACLYYVSQTREKASDRQPRSLRPDKTGVVMGPRGELDPNTLFIHVRPETPDAWRVPVVFERLMTFIERGTTIVIVIGAKRGILRNGQPMIWTTEDQIAKFFARPLAGRVMERVLPMGFQAGDLRR